MKKTLTVISLFLIVTISLLGSDLKISYIDVDQADCILIKTPNDKVLLIDAGKSNSYEKIKRELEKNNVKKIDTFIMTHAHEDHIGAAEYIIDNYEIGNIYLPKVTSNTKTFKDVVKSIKAKNQKIKEPIANTSIEIDPNIKVEILAPNSTKYKDINNTSIVVKITYKEFSAIFEGDAESESEKEMLEAGYNLKSTVLKVGHHGSTSSTTAKFLKAVSPEVAVIEVGANNDYNHPSIKTLERLEKSKIKVYRTDNNGTVIINSNGTTYEVITER